jgi:type VI secretion system lysozyme-like protein
MFESHGNEHVARAPLFARLVDLDPSTPEESRPLRVQSLSGLKESVRQEVGWLLNTRCPIPAHLLQVRERTVIDYGVPDLSLFFPRNPADQERLGAILSQAIASFEPRLQQVQVAVEENTENARALWVRIDAGLVVESLRESVSFQVLIRSKSGVTEVHERD